MTEDELAALTVALEVLRPSSLEKPGVLNGVVTSERSRWKTAARYPELEMEDLRALQ
jgi:hypothetical protein